MSTIAAIVAGILAVVFGAYKYNSSTDLGDVILPTTNSTTTSTNDSSFGNTSNNSSNSGSNVGAFDSTAGEGTGSSSGTYTPPVVEERWKMIPYRQIGPIKDTFTEDDLIDTFGAQNVSRQTIGREWGETIPASVIFPGTKNEMIIEWMDSKPYKRIKKARVEQENSQWMTAEGIGIGTTFDQLLKINGKGFQFYGFEWDYAGMTNNWQGGNIHEYVTVYLSPSNPRVVYPSMLGDTLFSSTFPKASEAGLFVTSIVIKM